MSHRFIDESGREQVVKAMVAVSVLRVLRAMKRAASHGRTVPVHQAVRMYWRERTAMDASATLCESDSGVTFVRDYCRELGRNVCKMRSEGRSSRAL